MRDQLEDIVELSRIEEENEFGRFFCSRCCQYRNGLNNIKIRVGIEMYFEGGVVKRRRYQERKARR